MEDGSDTDDAETIRKRKLEKMKRQAKNQDGPIQVENVDHIDQLIADRSPLLVDFYADWCGPCNLMEPTIEYIATESAATVAKVDVDEHEKLASRYNVQSIPTLLLFANGTEVERLVGGQDETTLLELVDSHA